MSFKAYVTLYLKGFTNSKFNLPIELIGLAKKTETSARTFLL